jgi:hypothetical protein
MTRCVAAMIAIQSFDSSAKLLAHIIRLFAFTLMAFLDALVTTAFQFSTARHSAAERVLIAWNCFPLFVLSVAEFCRKEDARRTISLSMTKMSDWMVAFMSSRALVGAFRRFSSARHWRVNNSSSTFASQFIERNAMTRNAVSDVTWKLTAMLFALEWTVAGLRADVIELDAAVLIAFVLSACLKLCAFLLATNVSLGQIFA